MKKALLMGASSAVMLFATQAFATGQVSQEQGFLAANVQGQAQGSRISADGGDGGTAKAYADGGSSSPSSRHSHHSSGGGTGGDAYAKGYGGNGGDAYASSKQLQGQGQLVAGAQKQTVVLPDIKVTVATPGTGGGGAAGPGLAGDGGDGGNAIGDNGSGNSQQSPVLQNAHDAAQASFRSRAAADIGRDAILGDNVTSHSNNITMTNTTTMDATNTVGDISLSSGNSTGGDARGGNLNPTQTALTGNLGRGGDAEAKNYRTSSGRGGSGGDGLAVSANVALQGAKSTNVSKGGEGEASSSAHGSSKAGAVGLAGAGALSANKGGANSSPYASNGGEGVLVPMLSSDSRHHHGSAAGDNTADASGKARNTQDSSAWAKAWTNPVAKANTNAQSAAFGAGGNGGDISSKTANLADQTAKSAAAGGNGGNSGDVYAKAGATGGDLSQTAASGQVINAATGGTQGGNGGNIAVSFGTGSIGGIGLGTMSGIANISQNTGLTANQFSSFSINARTNF